MRCPRARNSPCGNWPVLRMLHHAIDVGIPDAVERAGRCGGQRSGQQRPKDQRRRGQTAGGHHQEAAVVTSSRMMMRGFESS